MKKYLLFISLLFISVFMWSCNETKPDELSEEEMKILNENNYDYQFADKINFFIQTYSNFTLAYEYNSIKKEEFNPEIHLKIFNSTTLNYYGNNGNKTSKMKANIKAIFDDGSIEEFPEKEYPVAGYTTTGVKTGVQYLMTGKSIEHPIDKVDFNITYNVLNDEETYNLSLLKNFLKLSNRDLEATYKNDLIGASYEVNISGEITSKEIFKGFEVRKEENDDDSYKIRLDLTLNPKVCDKYFLDIQLFGVDKFGYIYEMGGIYNLSNNSLAVYSKTSILSNYIELEDVYVKAVFVDENEKVHNLMYKEKYINL